jgi:hypothetical protein
MIFFPFLMARLPLYFKSSIHLLIFLIAEFATPKGEGAKTVYSGFENGIVV